MPESEDKPLLPDVHFGEVDGSEDDEVPEAPDTDTDDDEELAETPDDVIELLGFDPKELEDEGEAGESQGSDNSNQ